MLRPAQRVGVPWPAAEGSDVGSGARRGVARAEGRTSLAGARNGRSGGGGGGSGRTGKEATSYFIPNRESH